MNRINLDWNELYEKGDTGWDVGEVSRPLKEYFDQLKSKDSKVLIPGAGFGHEAQYLINILGFKRVSVIDLSEIALSSLNQKLNPDYTGKFICGDFFSHLGQYDLIIEQTFFCAIRPWQRWEYVNKMYDLLKPGAKLVGLLFSEEFDKDGPPFGATIDAYKRYFSPLFNIKTMEECYNSIEPRSGRELFFILEKR